MHCKGKLKLRSLKTSYCLIEVVTKTGLTVIIWPRACAKSQIFMVTLLQNTLH